MLNMIAKQKASQEGSVFRRGFTQLCRLKMDSRTNSEAFERAKVTPEICTQVLQTFERADPGSIGGSSPTSWAGVFAPYQLLATAWLASLRSVGVFDAMLPAMMRVPMRTAVAVSSLSIVGDAVGEGESKPIRELMLSAEETDALKSVAVVVVSAELLKLVPIVEGMIDAELRAAVVAGTDAQFLDGLIAATTPTASSGDVIADLQALLGAVESGSASRYFFIVDPSAARQLASTPGANGVAFPNMGPTGGQIIPNIEVLVSDQLNGTAILADATGIAAASEGIALDAATHAVIDMGESPQAPVSLWQRNLRGLRAERWFAFKVIRSSAVASLSGVDYGGTSP